MSWTTVESTSDTSTNPGGAWTSTLATAVGDGAAGDEAGTDGDGAADGVVVGPLQAVTSNATAIMVSRARGTPPVYHPDGRCVLAYRVSPCVFRNDRRNHLM